MTRMLTALFALTVSLLPLCAQNAPQTDRLLMRRYIEGQRLPYLMKGQNNGQTYEVHLTGTVTKGRDGRLVDEFAWSEAIVNGAPRPLSPTNQGFRLAVTLSGGAPFEVPDLSKAQQLIGPVTDLMTFYADLYLAMHGGVLRQPGDHLHVPSPAIGSWADGTVVILGEDAVDFDITLTDIDASRGVASLLVRHVPPAAPKIRLVADWMHPPVADTPNNWVEIEKTPTGYRGSVGKETFDVAMRISLADGKILSAAIENPVVAISRDCSDAALTQCGDPKPNPTLRHIEMVLLRE